MLYCEASGTYLREHGELHEGIRRWVAAMRQADLLTMHFDYTIYRIRPRREEQLGIYISEEYHNSLVLAHGLYYPRSPLK
jgi:hypothetical protein